MPCACDAGQLPKAYCQYILPGTAASELDRHIHHTPVSTNMTLLSSMLDNAAGDFASCSVPGAFVDYVDCTQQHCCMGLQGQDVYTWPAMHV